MLIFCPYELNEDQSGYLEFDTDVLSYELIPYGTHVYEDFENEIKGSEIETLFVKGVNEQMERLYNDPTLHYYMPKPQEGEKIGPEKMRDILERHSVENAGSLAAIHLECYLNKESNVYSIYSTKGMRVLIAELIPCCPECGRRLPRKWLNKDEYIAIGLTAPKGAGKTTYLTSLYANVNSLKKSLGPKIISVSLAHYDANAELQDGIDYYHEQRKRDAEKLVKDGICPSYTNTTYRIAPSFLDVLVKSNDGTMKRLIVGIQDNSGEVLEKAERDERSDALECVYSQIYFMEPEQFGVMRMEERDVWLDENILLSIEEQGEMQDDLSTVRGVDLLESNKENKEKEIYPPMKVLSDLCQKVCSSDHSNNIETFYKQHIAFTIIKCDLLKETDGMVAVEKGLFEGGEKNSEHLWNDNLVATNNEINKEIFDQLICPQGTKEEKRNKKDADDLIDSFESKSWHVVSALGTGTIEYEPERFRVVGQYDPIRLTEPIATCIVNKIKELGW